MSTLAPDLLPKLEESFLRVIESVPDAMVLSDRDGRIVLANTNTEKLFGYRRDELLGKKVEILIPARFHSRHREHRVDYYSNTTIRPMGVGREFLAHRKDGAEFAVEINLSPARINGQLYVWSAIRDVTEREARFRQIQTVLQEQGVHGALVSICAWCKRVRDEHGSWQSLEEYVVSHTKTKFTHGLCVECLHRLDPQTK